MARRLEIGSAQTFRRSTLRQSRSVGKEPRDAISLPRRNPARHSVERKKSVAVASRKREGTPRTSFAGQKNAEPDIVLSPAFLLRKSTRGTNFAGIGIRRASANRTILSALGSRRIDGVGEVDVLLSCSTSAATEYVSDGDETVIVSTGSGKQEGLVRYTRYPQYLGAVIVCDGGGSADVRLYVTQAVSQFTGLSSDRITVLARK